MENWEVSRPLGLCFGTNRKIEAGEEYFAALVEVEGGFERRDFCAEYWQQDKPTAFCHWKTKLPEPNQKKQIFIDDEMLMTFFDRLGVENEQEKVNFRFVLTLILMRKRRLKYDSSKDTDGKEIWRLKVSGEDRFVEVVNPQLEQAQVAQLSGQLGQILHADL